MPRFIHKLQFTASMPGTGGRPISGYVNESGDAQIKLDVDTPAGSVDRPVALAFRLAGLHSLVIQSDKGCSLRLDGPAGSDRMELAAGLPFIWYRSGGKAPPWSGDVERGFVSSPVGQRLRVEGVTD